MHLLFLTLLSPQVWGAPFSGIRETLLQGSLQDDQLGTSLAVGDLDGDGLRDVATGAPGSDLAGVDAGSVFLLMGTDDWTYTGLVLNGDAPGDNAGTTVAIGDLDGDGYQDVVIGAPGADSGAFSQTGALLVYLSGNSRGNGVEGSAAGDELGSQLAIAGDTDGDGQADIVAGMPHSSGTFLEEGAVSVWGGAVDGLGPTLQQWRGTADYSYFGYAVAGAGDTDGDGYDDILVGGGDGQLTYSWFWLYPGSSTGPVTTPTWSLADPVSMSDGGMLGGVGDVNHDGYDDIGVAQPYDYTVSIYSGSSSGISGPAVLLTVAECEGFQDLHIGTAGDMDGDGDAEILLSVDCPNGGNPDWPINMAEVQVFNGASVLSSDPSWRSTLWYDGPMAVADVNHDSYMDLVVGQPDGQQQAGYLEWFMGELDQDGDGVGVGALWGSIADCNDSDSSIGFGSPEVDGDGMDANCDGEDNAVTSTYTRVCPVFSTLTEARTLADDPEAAFNDPEGAAFALWDNMAALSCYQTDIEGDGFIRRSNCSLGTDGVDASVISRDAFEEMGWYDITTTYIFASVNWPISTGYDPPTANFVSTQSTADVSSSVNTTTTLSTHGYLTWSDGRISTFDQQQIRGTVSEGGYQEHQNTWRSTIDNCTLSTDIFSSSYGADGLYAANVNDGTQTLSISGGNGFIICGMAMDNTHGWASWGSWEGIVLLADWSVPVDADGDGWPATFGDCDDHDPDTNPCLANCDGSDPSGDSGTNDSATNDSATNDSATNDSATNDSVMNDSEEDHGVKPAGEAHCGCSGGAGLLPFWLGGFWWRRRRAGPGA